MRVLGIDPGYAIVGWGVVEYISNRFAPIGYGAVITEKDTPFEQRLVEIYESVFDICKRYQPEALSIEKLYYQHNQTTVIGVAEARGVILLAAAHVRRADLRIHTPCRSSRPSPGYGKAREEADSGDDPHNAAPRVPSQARRYRRPPSAVAIAHCHCSRTPVEWDTGEIIPCPSPKVGEGRPRRAG